MEIVITVGSYSNCQPRGYGYNVQEAVKVLLLLLQF